MRLSAAEFGVAQPLGQPDLLRQPSLGRYRRGGIKPSAAKCRLPPRAGYLER